MLSAIQPRRLCCRRRGCGAAAVWRSLQPQPPLLPRLLLLLLLLLLELLLLQKLLLLLVSLMPRPAFP